MGEDISYFGGWLGDAVISYLNDGKTSFTSGDYIADLDAENIYQLLISFEEEGNSIITSVENYYYMIHNGTDTRATIFKSYLPLEIILDKVMTYLSVNEPPLVIANVDDTSDSNISIGDLRIARYIRDLIIQQPTTYYFLNSVAKNYSELLEEIEYDGLYYGLYE